MTGHFLILSAAAALVSLALLSAAPAATGSQAARVSAASSSLGRIVVDGRGRTLYLFEKDSHGRSACSGSCAMYWPPVITRGKPIAGRGLKSSLLGTIRRANGARQVTFAGHPLYRYVLDTRSGQTNGEACRNSVQAGTRSRPQGKRSRVAVTARQALPDDPRLELAAERKALSNARITAECGGPCAERVLVLQKRTFELVAKHQELRARAAGHRELEANRLALIQSQQQLSLH